MAIIIIIITAAEVALLSYLAGNYSESESKEILNESSLMTFIK